MGRSPADIPAVAADAEVSTGLIHRYFGSKAALFDAVPGATRSVQTVQDDLRD
ncbi:helix-turn-helix transcriptional regulator [Ectothiorhodospiraceae bacterium WFHF3C12]|nr:helix-turn-helix transcriptional regulator [Ectothiorhodospiraceae bacterium WFHF3C12]